MLAEETATCTVADLVNDRPQGLAIATMVAVAQAPASSVAGMAPTAPHCWLSEQPTNSSTPVAIPGGMSFTTRTLGFVNAPAR